MEPQGEEEERRELGDKQRPCSSGSGTVPLWGRALTAASGVRLCGLSAATAPSPVPSVCNQGQVCALNPRGSTLAGWQALQLLFALGLSGTPGTHRSPKLLRGPATLTSSTSVRPHLRYSQSWVGDVSTHPGMAEAPKGPLAASQHPTVTNSSPPGNPTLHSTRSAVTHGLAGLPAPAQTSCALCTSRGPTKQ